MNKRAIRAFADASGEAAGRVTGQAQDALTGTMTQFARAPDGRLFREIGRAGGVRALRESRSLQYTDAWLPEDR